MKIVCILSGGREFEIQVNGRRYKFEDHPYCGPTAMNRKGDPLSCQPMAFLEAASLWAQQGRRVERGLCVWEHEPEPILRHMGGRHYLFIGEKPRRNGE